jgi:uncharacterized DUF497 family protein
MLYFDWDPRKAAENLARHRISFGAASAALEDPYRIDWEDQFIEGELRHSTTGMAAGVAVVTVCYTLEPIGDGDEDHLARIISARKATVAERGEYEQARATDGGFSLE